MSDVILDQYGNLIDNGRPLIVGAPSNTSSIILPLPRRAFLKDCLKITVGVIGLVGGMTMSDQSWANAEGANTQQGWRQTLLNRPRALSLRRGNEVLRPSESMYWKPVAGNPVGQFNVEAYNRICWFMRDIKGNNQSVNMSVELLNIMVGLQNWLLYYGYDPTITITSAYRNPLRNSRIEGAAKNSWHTKGAALDFYHPKLSQSVLGKMAVMWGEGGVGFYPSKHFTHVDPGRVRTWRGR